MLLQSRLTAAVEVERYSLRIGGIPHRVFARDSRSNGVCSFRCQTIWPLLRQQTRFQDQTSQLVKASELLRSACNEAGKAHKPMVLLFWPTNTCLERRFTLFSYIAAQFGDCSGPPRDYYADVSYFIRKLKDCAARVGFQRSDRFIHASDLNSLVEPVIE